MSLPVQDVISEAEFKHRDLWREARLAHATQDTQTTFAQRALYAFLGLIAKAPPVRRGIMSLLSRNDQALVVDLSSYQPNANIEALADQGVG